MKITITQEFGNADEALEFLQRLTVQPAFAINITEPALAAPPTAAEQQTPPVKKARKPRSDAGQPRGEYKPREGAQQVEGAEHLNAKPEVSAPANPVPEAASKAAPSGAAPTPSAAPAKSSAVEPPQAAPAPAAADLTLEAIRATLGKLNAVPGKGMEACIATLKNFGVLRVSDLPKERYAEFDAYVRAQLPAAK